MLWYFILAFGITYGLSFLIMTQASAGGVRSVSSLLTVYSPTIAALVVSAFLGGWLEIKRLLSKILIWKVGLQWYLFVLFFPVLARSLAVGVGFLMSGDSPRLLYSETVNIPGIHPLLLLPILFSLNFIQPSLSEEIGWRGFALPRLQGRFGTIEASLFLGFLWGLWHFHPSNLPFYRDVMLWFLLSTICASVIYTWVYTHTGGSVLLAALFHASSNVSEFIIPVAPLNTGSEITIAYVTLDSARVFL